MKSNELFESIKEPYALKVDITEEWDKIESKIVKRSEGLVGTYQVYYFAKAYRELAKRLYENQRTVLFKHERGKTMNEQIFLLYSCNDHKEWSSMRLVAATTNEYKLNFIIERQIEEGYMGYGGLKGDEAVDEFHDSDEYNYARLDNGFVDVVEDGVIQ